MPTVVAEAATLTHYCRSYLQPRSRAGEGQVGCTVCAGSGVYCTVLGACEAGGVPRTVRVRGGCEVYGGCVMYCTVRCGGEVCMRGTEYSQS